MKQNLTHIAIVVEDYDKAIEFYTQRLNFNLIEDTVLSETKRWVLVRPKGANECSLLLAKGVNDEQKSRIGNYCHPTKTLRVFGHLKKIQ